MKKRQRSKKENQRSSTGDGEKAAIVFASIAGLQELKRRNAERAARVFHGHRKMIEPIIARHRGDVIQAKGNGVLIMFASAIEAVDCCVAIHIARALGNKKINPDHRVQVRMGVHFGEVINEFGDIMGDEIQIARIITSGAMPGGICITEPVCEQVRMSLPYPIGYLTEQEVDGQGKTIDVFEVQVAGLRRDALDEPAPANMKNGRRRFNIIALAAALGSFAATIVFGSMALYQFSRTTESSKIFAGNTTDTGQPAQANNRFVNPPKAQAGGAELKSGMALEIAETDETVDSRQVISRGGVSEKETVDSAESGNVSIVEGQPERLIADGFEPAAVTDKKPASAELLESQPTGILFLKVKPEGHTILLNGEIKEAPRGFLTVSPGVEHNLVITKAGYETFNRKIKVRSATEPEEIQVELQPKEKQKTAAQNASKKRRTAKNTKVTRRQKPGALYFKTTPMVYVKLEQIPDDSDESEDNNARTVASRPFRVMFSTPNRIRSLPPGRYRATMANPRLRIRETMTFTVKPGRTKRIIKTF